METVTERYGKFVELAGTLNDPPPGTKAMDVDKNRVISATIVLRRRKSIDDALTQVVRMTREEFDLEFSIPEDDFTQVEDFADYFNLSVEKCDKLAVFVVVKGCIADFEKAFKVALLNYIDGNGNIFLGRIGYIFVPETLYTIIDGIFGLDSRPTTRPLLTTANSKCHSYKSVTGYTPLDVAAAYGFPKGVNGKGQCIGIVELGGGYRNEDLENYFASLNIMPPEISWIGIDGAFNAPTIAESYDKEITMNIEVAGAIAPGAKIVVYFAPNTEQGFLNAITAAIHDKINRPSVISISWGAPEEKWSIQSLVICNEAFKIAAILGVTICVASGNGGVKDGVKGHKYHVDFPASSPFVLSCGGTSLFLRKNVLVSETAWFQSHHFGSAGGVSEFFPLPDYQENARVPLSKNASKFKGRGVPDVAGNADPLTGYNILVHGKYVLIAGTSSVAPLYAGLVAITNELKNAWLGFVNPMLYANTSLCRNISQTNFQSTLVPVYRPGSGWDACTGLGVLSKL